MSKKVQFVVWTIIAIVAVLIIGVVAYSAINKMTEKINHPEATFEIENYGTVKMELYPEYAPNTVANFIKLIEAGYYNNKVIYGKDEICLYVGRNSEGQIANPKISLISSDIEADSEGDYEYSIKGEFAANDFEQNTLRYEKGIVSIIRDDYTQYISSLTEQSYNSGNSQIGIMMSDDARSLNGAYAAFARVTEGMDVLEKIYNEGVIKAAEENADAQSDSQSEATDDIDQFESYPVITSASVDTHGEDFGMPETQEAFDYDSYMQNLMSQYADQ